MKEDMLDQPIKDEFDNREPTARIILLSVITIFLYFLIEMLRDIVPENLYEKDGVKIQTLGLIIVGVLIFNSILISNQLNKIRPILNILEIVILTGIIISTIEFFFKLIQNVMVLKNGLNLDYIQLLESLGLFGIIGMLVSNIRIHKLRGRKILKPILILFGVWMVIGLIISNK